MRKLLIALGAALIFLTGYSFADNDTARERGHAVALDAHHVVVGCDTDSMVVRLVFSADSMFEGGEYAVGVLDSMHVPASFFFTGNFLRMKEYEPLIRRIVADGHYVGTHSNHHLLLADWDGKRTPLITPDSMLADLDSNYLELARFGVKRRSSGATAPMPTPTARRASHPSTPRLAWKPTATIPPRACPATAPRPKSGTSCGATRRSAA